jgi:hypothetical protein
VRFEIEVSYKWWAVFEHCEIGSCSRRAVPTAGFTEKLLEELQLPAIAGDTFFTKR